MVQEEVIAKVFRVSESALQRHQTNSIILNERQTIQTAIPSVSV